MTAARSPAGRADRPVLAGVAACALAVAALLVFQATASRRAVLRLAPAERAELFARTRAEAEALCARPETVFEEECRRHLELLQVFPECDAPCQRFARAHLFRPVR